jgi:Domain of unknown function (DUF4249)
MKYLGLVFLAFMFWSCEKTVLLDLDQSPSKIVIEGLVTNQPGYQFVKVTRTVDFYESGETPRIADATVLVRDDLGNQFSYTHNPNNHPDSAGFYLPVIPFLGTVNRTYYLSVNVNGEQYEASDKLYGVTSIDSLEYRLNKDEQDDPKDKGKFYEVLMYAKEPQETDDYYLFKFFRNDSLVLYNPSDIYFSDDKTLGEEINGIPSPVFYAAGDTARVEMYSLSRTGYVFYNDLFNLINNDGGMFSPPPANSRTNLSNGALGFFQVSSVNISGLRINPD